MVIAAGLPSATRRAAAPAPARGPRSITALGFQVLVVAAQFVTGLVLTRLLSPDDVGTWFSVMSASLLATAVIGQGLPFGASRAIAADPATTATVVRTTLARTLVPWAVLTALAIVAATRRPGDVPDAVAIAVLALVVVGPALLERIASEVGRGLHQDWIGILGDGVLARTAFAAVGVGLVLAGASVGVIGLLVVLQVCSLAFVAYATASVARRRPGGAPAGTAPGVFTWSLWAHAITQAFLSQGDLAIATLFLSGDDVAVYGIAWRVGSLIAMPLGAMISVVPGRIYRRVADGDADGLRAMMLRPMRRAMAISLVAFAGLVLVGRPALGIAFGDDYRAAYVPMVVIALGQLVAMWSGPVGYVLIGARRERALLVATLSSCATLALLAPIGAVLLDAVGVALAMALTLVVSALTRNAAGRRVLGERGLGSVWRFRERQSPGARARRRDLGKVSDGIRR